MYHELVSSLKGTIQNCHQQEQKGIKFSTQRVQEILQQREHIVVLPSDSDKLVAGGF